MKLTLYHYVGCPYCDRVWDAAQRLGVEMSERDIMRSREFRQELVSKMGRATVPVLRIEHDDGSEEWMPESRDIIRHLSNQFG